jgi:hypothetical protein
VFFNNFPKKFKAMTFERLGKVTGKEFYEAET